MVMNRYEGTIKSAVYDPVITNRWGVEQGGLGYTLHVFIDLINGESVQKILNIPYAVIEINCYSDPISKRYHYKDLKTGYTKTSYLSLLSPFVKDKNGDILCKEKDVAIDHECTQRVHLWSLANLEPKKHRKWENKFYYMNDNKTMFYTLKKAHIRDLWIAEDVVSSNCSYNVKSRELIGV